MASEKEIQKDVREKVLKIKWKIEEKNVKLKNEAKLNYAD